MEQQDIKRRKPASGLEAGPAAARPVYDLPRSHHHLCHFKRRVQQHICPCRPFRADLLGLVVRKAIHAGAHHPSPVGATRLIQQAS